MKTPYIKLNFLFIALVFTQLVFSQLSKTHYIPPLTAAEFGNANPENQYFYISTPSESDVAFTIKKVGLSASFDEHHIVSKTSPQEIFIDFEYGQLFIPSYSTSQVISNRGFIIEAEDVIYVSVRMEAGGAQAGALVSKGISALGTEFRVGTYTNENPTNNYLNFVSVMATEDDTKVNFDDLPADLIIKNYSGSIPIQTTLDKGESYTIATNSSEAISNRDGLIGALVTSDKPIVVNTGSANGSFHNGNFRDYGLDQIVGTDKIGMEYIFVRGSGTNDWENVLIVAHEDDTEININGVAEGINLTAGEYHLIEGDKYSTNGNMYVETSKPVFAYQGVGGLGNNGTPNEANQGMFFVPPLSCETKGNVENIANINKIGNEIYAGGLSIVTKKGATVTINNLPITSFTSEGPFPVSGNSNYETYKVIGLSGITTSVECSDELYCAYFNYNGSATSGSFYSGFPSPPEINYDVKFDIKGNCLENDLKLMVANTDSFDSFEWWFNDGTGFISTGETGNIYIPTKPGTYQLIGVLDCSGNEFKSDEIPIGHCPDDTDDDGIIDNLDIDNDNDGILNCTESLGNKDFDFSNISGGSFEDRDYSFVGTESTAGHLTGDNTGVFMSDLILNSRVEYQLSFNAPLNIAIELPASTSLGTIELNDESEFVFKVSNSKTITLIDPDDQLLIDSNYDGVYESGFTQFSSVEIHFKIKPGETLNLGEGSFIFYANSVDELSYIHKNTSITNSNNAAFKITATCLPLDTDSDGITNEFDDDSDNDKILDIVENQGTETTPSGSDTNNDGLDDVFENIDPIDSDGDSVFDYIDLDSDNDGIYDEEESGNDLSDMDSDAFFNYIDIDSDGDLCFDVLEAGFLDANNDGYLGDTTPIIVDKNGLVINTLDGYADPNADYTTAAPITINLQPEAQVTCELDIAIFSIEIEEIIDSYQWQVSIDNGTLWTDITDDTIYSDSESYELTLTNIPLSFNKYLYRVLLNTSGNSCGAISNEISLTVNPLPIIIASVDLTQCDDDSNDGISFFNLNESNILVKPDLTNETFKFYKTKLGAETSDSVELISDTDAISFKSNDNTKVYSQTITEFGCFKVAEIILHVEPTQLSPSFQRAFSKCDDYLDTSNDNRDGISTFDFSSVTEEIYTELNTDAGRVKIAYYENQHDALAEENPIDPANYRNTNYPLFPPMNSHQIYVRIDSNNENACIGLGPHITLTVEPLPTANEVSIERECDDDFDGMYPFDVSIIESNVLNGQTNVTISYFNEIGNFIGNSLPNPFLTESQTITIRVTNNSTNDPEGACFDETALEFIVDTKPVANPINISPVCDDESNDGFYDFDTSVIQSTILGTQTNMEVNYYDESGLKLPSPLPNPFNTTSQTIIAEVINPINTNCIATTTLDFKVNSLPDFYVETPRVLCITEPVSSITLDAFLDDKSEVYNYKWVDPNGNVSNTKSLVATKAGIYYVSLIKTDGTNCERTLEIVVENSEYAKIDLDDILIEDDSKNNTITIITDNNNLGIGDYEFALDSDVGFQDEPFFDYVEPGVHTIFVNDKKGCAPSYLTVSVLYFPKYFTPNNDGQNDYWNVIGIDPQIYKSVKISIFDRFGKLMGHINSFDRGWNGLYNGEYLPSTDYWYAVELVDNNNILRSKKGHFSLIR